MAALLEKREELLFDNLLSQIYQDQKRIIEEWGVTLPKEEDLFHETCPMETKVLFFDWLIREGLAA